MNPTVYTDLETQQTIPVAELSPDAMFGGSEALEESDGSPSLWSRYHPREVPFFKVALLDQLVHRPYHVATLEGPLKVKQLAQDHRDHMFRSETSINRTLVVGAQPVEERNAGF